MQPTRALWKTQADLMAADTAFLAAVAAMHVHLFVNAAVPQLDMVLADFTEATFVGSGPLNIGTGTQIVYYDALTGLLTILLKAPAGGLHWVCTTDPVTPQTVRGVFLTDNADAVLIAAKLLPTPQTISASGQGLDIPDLMLQFRVDSPV